MLIISFASFLNSKQQQLPTTSTTSKPTTMSNSDEELHPTGTPTADSDIAPPVNPTTPVETTAIGENNITETSTSLLQSGEILGTSSPENNTTPDSTHPSPFSIGQDETPQPSPTSGFVAPAKEPRNLSNTSAGPKRSRTGGGGRPRKPSKNKKTATKPTSRMKQGKLKISRKKRKVDDGEDETAGDGWKPKMGKGVKLPKAKGRKNTRLRTKTQNARIWHHTWDRNYDTEDSESDLSTSNFEKRTKKQEKVYKKGNEGDDDLRWWWNGVVKVRTSRHDDPDIDNIFSQPPNYVYDGNNNIIGPGVNYHELEAEATMEDMTDEDKRVFSAVHHELCTVLNMDHHIGSWDAANLTVAVPPPPLGILPSGDDSWILKAFCKPVISSCVVFVVQNILNITFNEAKKLLQRTRIKLLLEALRGPGTTNYKCFGPPTDYFHPIVMRTLLRENRFNTKKIEPQYWHTLIERSKELGVIFLIYGIFNMDWEPYRKYWLWGTTTDILIKWDITPCQLNFWYGFQRDRSAKDSRERLHVVLVKGGEMFCNNLRKYNVGIHDADSPDGFFSVPFAKVWRLKKTKNKRIVEYIADPHHRLAYLRKITRVLELTPRREEVDPAPVHLGTGGNDGGGEGEGSINAEKDSGGGKNNAESDGVVGKDTGEEKEDSENLNTVDGEIGGVDGGPDGEEGTHSFGNSDSNFTTICAVGASESSSRRNSTDIGDVGHVEPTPPKNSKKKKKKRFQKKKSKPMQREEMMLGKTGEDDGFTGISEIDDDVVGEKNKKQKKRRVTIDSTDEETQDGDEQMIDSTRKEDETSLGNKNEAYISPHETDGTSNRIEIVPTTLLQTSVSNISTDDMSIDENSTTTVSNVLPGSSTLSGKEASPHLGDDNSNNNYTAELLLPLPGYVHPTPVLDPETAVPTQASVLLATYTKELVATLQLVTKEKNAPLNTNKPDKGLVEEKQQRPNKSDEGLEKEASQIATKINPNDIFNLDNDIGEEASQSPKNSEEGLEKEGGRAGNSNLRRVNTVDEAAEKITNQQSRKAPPSKKEAQKRDRIATGGVKTIALNKPAHVIPGGGMVL